MADNQSLDEYSKQLGFNTQSSNSDELSPNVSPNVATFEDDSQPPEQNPLLKILLTIGGLGITVGVGTAISMWGMGNSTPEAKKPDTLPVDKAVATATEDSAVVAELKGKMAMEKQKLDAAQLAKSEPPTNNPAPNTPATPGGTPTTATTPTTAKPVKQIQTNSQETAQLAALHQARRQEVAQEAMQLATLRQTRQQEATQLVALRQTKQQETTQLAALDQAKQQKKTQLTQQSSDLDKLKVAAQQMQQNLAAQRNSIGKNLNLPPVIRQVIATNPLPVRVARQVTPANPLPVRVARRVTAANPSPVKVAQRRVVAANPLPARVAQRRAIAANPLPIRVPTNGGQPAVVIPQRADWEQASALGTYGGVEETATAAVNSNRAVPAVNPGSNLALSPVLRLPVGTMVSGKLVTPFYTLISNKNGVNQNAKTSATITIDKAIEVGSGWHLPVGTAIEFDFQVADNGMIQAISKKVTYDQTEIAIPPGAFSITSSDNQPLFAQIKEVNGDRLAAADAQGALWGGLSEIGNVLVTSGNSSTVSVGAGTTIATSNSGSPNILGAILKGAFSPLAATQVGRSNSLANTIEKQSKVAYLLPGTAMRVYVAQAATFQIPTDSSQTSTANPFESVVFTPPTKVASLESNLPLAFPQPQKPRTGSILSTAPATNNVTIPSLPVNTSTNVPLPSNQPIDYMQQGSPRTFPNPYRP